MQKKQNEVAITKTYDLAKPVEAIEMANVLKTYVVKQKLYTNIKGKNYCHVDGWQFAGFLSGITAIVDSVESVSSGSEIKWRATAKVYRGDKHIATGFALCSSKETSKKAFDEYAILSMAQTRAIGKAYRNLIGWIMKLAGYESTPSEEMGKMGDVPQKYEPEPISEDGPVQTPVKLEKGQILGPDGKPAWACEICGGPVTNSEKTYSQKIYKKTLCREDQANAKKR